LDPPQRGNALVPLLGVVVSLGKEHRCLSCRGSSVIAVYDLAEFVLGQLDVAAHEGILGGVECLLRATPRRLGGLAVRPETSEGDGDEDRADRELLSMKREPLDE